MKYKIIVDKQSRTNPSEEKREYEVDVEELRIKGNVYDSLIITKDESYVMRRLELTDFYVLKELETPIKEPLENINIELFEGDNYIYLIDMTGNKFYAEYLLKNEFNDTYVIQSEMNAAIDLSAKGIELNVNKKLQNYSTIEEMKSAIQLLSNSIALELIKKVNNEDYTSAQILLKINNDTSEAKINADKIALTATEILNLIAGNQINLTSKNMEIKSTNFNVSKIGEVQIYDDGISENSGKLKLTSFDNWRQTKICSGVINQIQTNTNHISIFSPSNILLSHVTGEISDYGIFGQICDANSQEDIKLKLKSSSGTDTTITPTTITTPKLTQTSLESQKKNFEKFTQNAIEIIKQIELYKYNLKDEEDAEKKHIGFVIGDKYKYSKEVTSNDNTGVDLYSFISLCCKAIQEQQEQIEQLKKNDGERDNLIKTLIEKIEKLEAKNEKESI